MHDQTAEIAYLQQELQKERQARLSLQHRYEELLKLRHENPNPILRFSEAGQLMAANAASLRIVNALLDEEQEPFLGHLTRQVLECSGAQKPLKTEQSFKGRHYMVYSVPVRNERYVNVYLTDISDRKAMENSL
jgi:hypothetical protein